MVAGRRQRVSSLNGMTLAMQRLAGLSYPGFPLTIYYAFKQSESNDDLGITSTGWETFLDAVIRAGFAVTGTWPIRTENTTRLVVCLLMPSLLALYLSVDLA